MPWGDRTGPEGRGPMTGRGLGYCAGYSSPGFTKGVPRGRGFGRRGYYPEPYYEPATPYYPPYQERVPTEQAKKEEKAYLEDTVKGLDGELKAIKERLQELSKEKKEAP